MSRVLSQSTLVEAFAGIAFASALASTSYLSESIQLGPPESRNGEATMPYAFKMSARTVLLVAVNLPPGRIIEGSLSAPDLFCFTDATSNESADEDCPQLRGAF